MPQTVIKAQTLAHFLVECTIAKQEVGGQEDIDEQAPEQGKNKILRKTLRWLSKNIGCFILTGHQKQNKWGKTGLANPRRVHSGVCFEA